MMKKRLTSLALSAMMVLSMVPATAFAAKDAGTPPTYNSATGCYEISTPAQLLYLAGKWKDGAPRDGHYVLTADIDMTGVKGFKPIASKKAEGFEAKVFPTREEKIAYAFRKGTSGYRIQ